MKYMAEEVREWAAFAQAQGKLYAPMKGAHDPWEKLEAMLTAYADLLERIKADEGANDRIDFKGMWNAMSDRAYAHPPVQAVVTDAVVQRAEQAFWPVYSECKRVHEARKDAHATGMRAALLAVWPSVPAQATQVDLRNSLLRGKAQNEEPRVRHLCNMGVGCEEAGICYAEANGQPEQCSLPIAESVAHGEACKICGKDTPHHHLRGTVPTSAQPAVRMVEGWVMVPREPTAAMLAAYEHVRSGADWQENVFRLTKKQLARHKAAYTAMLAAAPSQPEDANCSHTWVTDGINPTRCSKCRRPATTISAESGEVGRG